MGVNHLAVALERALIPYNPQLDQRSLGERSQRVNITASDAQFRNTGRESRARMEIGYLSRGDKWAPKNRTLIGPLRGVFLLNHQHQYAASSKTKAQGVFPNRVTHSFYYRLGPEYLLPSARQCFASGCGNSAVTL
jgi:hypothetical protein